jgi:hypothetical protein
VGDSVAAARDVSHVTKLQSYKRVLKPSPHVFKPLPTSYKVIHRFRNYTSRIVLFSEALSPVIDIIAQVI